MAPQPPLALERRVLRRATRLGPRASRAIFGAPPTLDGHTLSHETHAMLTLSRWSGEAPDLYAGRSAPETRAVVRHSTEVVAPRPAIPLAEIRPISIPGPDRSIPARLYRPQPPSDEPLPLLVYLHSGGFVFGDLDTHEPACRFLALAAGVAVLAIDYRLAPEHPFPAPLDDAWAALRWALANAGELDADPTRVAIGGDSAGANMTAALAVMARDAGGPSPAMQALIYPPTEVDSDFPSRDRFASGFLLTKADIEAFEAAYIPEGVDRADPRISVLRTPDLRGLPPAYVATAGFDPLRDEGEAYAARLREAGVKVALRRHPSLIHGYLFTIGVNQADLRAAAELAGALRMGLAA